VHTALPVLNLPGELEMSVESVRRYIAGGYEQIPGWCSVMFMEIIGHLAEEMNAAGVIGGACEIGVYQGTFVIGLSHAVEGRPSLAIDLFDNQQENMDNSGGGRENMLTGFRENVAKIRPSHAGRHAGKLIRPDRSGSYRCLGPIRPFSVFSIDGGHQAEHVVSDYKFAEEARIMAVPS
jgi:hypothetical protein